MRLSCRMLSDVQSANSFEHVDVLKLNEGDAPTVYIQLVDLDRDKASDGFKPSGRRYMPPVASTLQVVLDHIDTAKKVTRAATQPFSQDASIWSIALATTDYIRGTITVRLQLTETSPARVLRGAAIAAIRASAADAWEA